VGVGEAAAAFKQTGLFIYFFIFSSQLILITDNDINM
jgi:hypothetical protein